MKRANRPANKKKKQNFKNDRFNKLSENKAYHTGSSSSESEGTRITFYLGLVVGL